jgi:3-hydroxyacyl-CoA dehydrogenase
MANKQAAIQRAAVIGAGVMGAGIAAQLANAGVPVLLLDIVPRVATTAARWPGAPSHGC